MATSAANAAAPAGDESETATSETEEVATEEETEAPAEGEETEAEAPAVGEEDAAAKGDDEAEKPAADETPKDLKALTVEELSKELTEDQLRRVGQKFANKTMAAARRAERATDEIRQAHEKLSADHKTYREFADALRPGAGDIMAQLRRVGWQSFKQLAEAVRDGKDAGAEPPKVDPRVEALERKLADKERAEREAAQQATARNSQAAVYAALEKEPERFDLVLTDLGRTQLWDAIVAYHGKYGSCPDDKVYAMADLIEGRLTDQVAKSKKFTARPSVKAGTPPAAKPIAGAKGKTITNRSSSAAPSTRKNDVESEKERDRRINAEMRAAGELT